jgi:TRAP-type C4-dicarboxylate transport system permease small subunit
MNILSKIDLFFNKINFYIITILGLSLVAIVFYGVLRRYIFNIPLIWGYELSILLFMWVGFLSMAMGFRKNRHRAITFIVDKIKKDKTKKIIEIFLSVVITCILVTCVVTGLLVFIQMYPRSFRTLNLSLGWQFLPLPFSFAVMSITSIKNMIEVIRNNSIKFSTDEI